MKVSVEREKLTERIGLAEKVSGKNLTLPVLNCVLLEAMRGVVSVRATNLEVGIEIKIPAKVEKDGVVAVPGSILLNTLTSIRDPGYVVLEKQANNLRIKTKGGETVIASQDPSDFPTLPSPKPDVTFSIPSMSLVSGIRSVWYSASTSTIKPELASVYVYLKDKQLYFVATDSFRLAEKKINISTVLEMEPVLIPSKNVPELLRALERGSGDVEVRVASSQISFVFDDVYVTTRLIDGTFPDYKQIIPKESSTEAVVLKQDLIDTLKKSIIFSDKFNQIHFSIKPSKKYFSISSKNPDIGETEDSVVGSLSGDDMEINFNHRYVLDVFQSIPVDSISLTLVGPGKPMVIRGVSDSSFLYLVMPMNK